MTQFSAPPVRTEFPDARAPSSFSRGWIQWFQAITNYFNTPVTVTGSRGGNAALASLLAGLSSKGIVKDETTP